MLAVIDLTPPQGQLRQLVVDAGAEWAVVGEIGSRLVTVTTEGAAQGRIVGFDMAEPSPWPVELVAEADAILNDAVVAGDRLILGYLVEAKTELRRFTLDGRPDGTIDLPGIGTAGGFSALSGSPDCYLVFTGFDVPATVLRYHTTSAAVSVWAAPVAHLLQDRVRVGQHFCASKDGTCIPYFRIRRSDVTRPAPTLLYGYGGFGISLVPVHNEAQLAWVEQGGAGGGQYPRWRRVWYRMARGGPAGPAPERYDDFIAVAAQLKASGITPPKGLAIQGGIEWRAAGRCRHQSAPRSV